MKNFFLRTANFLLLLLLLAVWCDAQNPKQYSEEEISKVEKLFDSANQLMDEKKFAEALVKYKEALTIADDSTGLLYNGGLAAFYVKEFDTALNYWSKLKVLDENDWQLRTKLVQTYQALGKLSERDAERKELFDLRKSGLVKELKDAEFYVREQTEIAGRKIMVFEHFELTGDRALRYVFYILGENEKPEFRISLGSYETTNRVWREVGKRKADERLFHLDGYFSNGGHATYGMYPKEPTYDETREMVKKILEKEKKPVSSTTIVNPPAKKQENEKPE